MAHFLTLHWGKMGILKMGISKYRGYIQAATLTDRFTHDDEVVDDLLWCAQQND